ncbi:hypothetical protein G9464_16725 [Halostella sp. JP-L12]|uniref:hypothetical protein n=1 Tax=Halostella TaxID=1843185 RepID=UPI000EF84701|nr:MULTISPECIES: hypothetical protein [Halostella]NHN49224.1 hypothetical protein [Halostella sp. JP-L12]
MYVIVLAEPSNDDLDVRQDQCCEKGSLGNDVGSREAGATAVFDATRQTNTYVVTPYRKD